MSDPAPSEPAPAEPPITNLRAGAHRAIDQAVSSGTNFLWLVALSALLTAGDFGAMGLASSLFALVLGAARTTTSERVSLAGSTSGRQPVATVALLALWGAASVAVAAVWIATDRPVVSAWLAVVPLVLLHDRIRYISLAGTSRLAITADVVWLVGVVVAWVACAIVEPAPVVTAWSVSVAPVVTSLLVVAVPAAGSLALRVERDLRASLREAPYVVDGWLLAGGVFVALVILAAIGSLAEAGTGRALLLAFQPFLSLAYAGRLHLLAGDLRAAHRWPRQLAAATAVYAIAAGGVLWVLGRWEGTPAVWRVGALAFVLVAVGQIARSFHQGLSDLARRSHPRGLVAARSVFAIVLVGATAALVGPFGVTGYAAAVAAGFCAGAVAAHRFVGPSSELA